MGKRLMMGLARSRQGLFGRIREFFRLRPALDAETIERVEETLVELDLGVETALGIVEELKAAWGRKEVRDAGELAAFLRARLCRHIAGAANRALILPEKPPGVILVVGVNGTGKTTSIAKLAGYLRGQGKQVLLAAGDTFRAAAVEQLETWSRRLGVELIRQPRGADPAAVAYDAAEAAAARGLDALIVDTAGRLHTRANLMQELEKIRRVLGRRIPGAPHETLLVLDATTGQNALVQARAFQETAGVTGIFLAKLDGTAKGGIVVAIQNEIGLQVKFIGVGEQPEDIEPFDPERYAEALFPDDSF